MTYKPSLINQISHILMKGKSISPRGSISPKGSISPENPYPQEDEDRQTDVGKKIDFVNQIPTFHIRGTYRNGKITDLYVNCSTQICSSSVDFFPKWKIVKGKLLLEFTPKYVTEDGDKTIKL